MGNNYSGPMEQATLVGDNILGWNGTVPGPTIYALEGQTFSLNLISNDTFDHQFFLDVNNDRIPSCLIDKCSTYFDTTTQYTFQVDISPGTYNYYCALYRGTMRGWFVVLGNNGTTYNSGGGSGYPYGGGGNSQYNYTGPSYGSIVNWMRGISSALNDPTLPRSTIITTIAAIGFIGMLAVFAMVAIVVYRTRRDYLW